MHPPSENIGAPVDDPRIRRAALAAYRRARRADPAAEAVTVAAAVDGLVYYVRVTRPSPIGGRSMD